MTRQVLWPSPLYQVSKRKNERKIMTERILHIFGTLNRGGAETLVMNIYRNIDRSKIQFDFVVHHEEEGAYEEEVRKLGGNIYRVPNYKGTNHFAYKKAW